MQNNTIVIDDDDDEINEVIIKKSKNMSSKQQHKKKKTIKNNKPNPMPNKPNPMPNQKITLGHCGLINLGNMCFLNSTLQILRNTPLLNDIMENIQPKPDLPESFLFNEWNDLRKIMETSLIVSPKRFVYFTQQLAKHKKMDLFTGFSQNDLSEFLLFIVQCLHTSISRHVEVTMAVVHNEKIIDTQCYAMLKSKYETDYSEIMDTFYGVLVSEIISLDGKHMLSQKPEHYFVLDLELPVLHENENLHVNSIYDCLDEFTCSEILDNENAWFNEKTGKKEDIQKRIRFWNFPKVLAITLKRFSYDGLTKRDDFIDYPVTQLDLCKYACAFNNDQYIYDLYGVCCHYGNVNNGHYTTIVMSGKNEWFHYNDQHVEKITCLKKIIVSEAYCLFYVKRM
jgi:ubiquitin C-terminal hydrolase